MAMRNYSGLIAVFVSVCLSLGIGTSLYYFKTQQNEQTQNQLHFAELKSITNDFYNALGRISRVADWANKVNSENCVPNKKNVDCIKIDKETISKLEDNAKKSNTFRNLAIQLNCPDKDSDKSDQETSEKDPTGSVTYRIAKSNQALYNPDNPHSLVSNLRCFTLNIPLEDLFNIPLKNFSTVVLVNEESKVLATLRNNKEDAYQYNLNFSDFSQLAKILSAKKQVKSGDSQDQDSNGPQNFSVSHSTFVEYELGGKSFRLYISPVFSSLDFSQLEPTGNETAALLTNISAQQLTLVGLAPLSDISYAKLHVSPSVSTAMIFAMAIFLVALPLIKLRFVSYKYCFKKGDTWLIAVGLLLLIGFLTIYAMQSLLGTETHRRLDANAIAAHSLLKGKFKEEVEAASQIAFQFASKDFTNSDTQQNPLNCLIVGSETDDKQQESCTKLQEGIVVKEQPSKNSFPQLESIFKIERKGQISPTVFRTAEVFNRTNRPNLSHRQYYQTIENETGWKYWLNLDIAKPESELELELEPFSPQFYLQRIFNLEDGRKSSQLAWSLPEDYIDKYPAENDPGEEKQAFNILSAAIILQSLKEPVLPRNMQFLIFNPDNGTVLFSSDENQSLVENFYISTENSVVLKHYLAKSYRQHPIDNQYWQEGLMPYKFDGIYQGNDMNFYIAPVHHNMPWALVILQDQYEIQQIGLLTSITAMIMLIGLMLFACALVRLTVNHFPWQSFLLFLKQKRDIYLSINVFILSVIILQLIGIFWLQDMLFQMLFGALNLIFIKRLASVYLLPNRRVKKYTSVAIALLFLAALWRLSYLESESVNYIDVIFFLILCGLLLFYFITQFVPTVFKNANSAPIIGLIKLNQTLNKRLSWSIRNRLERKRRNIILVALFSAVLLLGLLLGKNIEEFEVSVSAQSVALICLFSLPVMASIFDWYQLEKLWRLLVTSRSIRRTRKDQQTGNLSHSNKPIKNENRQKFVTYHSLNILLLLLAISMIPSVIFTNAVHRYMLQSLEAVENVDILTRKNNQKLTMKTYFNYIGHKDFYAGSAEHGNNGSTVYAVDFTNEYCAGGDCFWRESSFSQQKQNISYPIISQLFKTAHLMLDFPLQFNAIQEQPNAKKVVFIDDQFILQSSVSNGLINVMLFIAALLLLLFYICRYMISGRLLGTDLSDNFRKIEYHAHDEADVGRLTKLLLNSPEQTQYAMVLRPVRQHVETLINAVSSRIVLDRVLDLRSILMTDSQLLLAIDDDELKQETIKSLPSSDLPLHDANLLIVKKTISNQIATRNILVIKNLGSIAFDADFRRLALQFIEFALTIKSLNIIILADVSPLYKLTRQFAYPTISQQDTAKSNERTLWSNIFAKFKKYYDWNPRQEEEIKLLPNRMTFIQRETECWPEMYRIKQELFEYHFTQNLNVQQRNEIEHEFKALQAKGVCESVFATPMFKCSIESWSESQIIEFIGEHAGAIFRYRWEQCTKNERVLLYYLATDHLANPKGYGPLTHLIRRGYIVKNTVWTIKSKSFGKFVLNAESTATFSKWLEESREGLWNYVRVPLLTMLLVLTGVIIYSATDAIESVVGLMTAFLTLTPILIRSMSSFKTTAQSTPPPSSEG